MLTHYQDHFRHNLPDMMYESDLDVSLVVQLLCDVPADSVGLKTSLSKRLTGKKEQGVDPA